MEKKINLLIVAPDFPPSTGGVEKFVGMLASNVSDRRFNIRVLAGTRLNHDINSIQEDMWEGVPVVRIPTARFQGMEWAKNIASYMRIWKEMVWADVIHQNDVRCFFTTAILVSAIKSKKFVLTTLGLIFHTKRNMWAKRIYSFYFIRMLKMVADRIVANGYADFEYCQKRGLDVELIDMGIDFGSWSKLVRSPVRGKFMYFGRIDRNKGIDLLLRALVGQERLIGEFCLYIGGKGNDDVVKELVCLSKELGMGKNVVWLGALSEEELKSHLSTAELVFNPSLFESFGFTLVEAAACGCTIIANTNDQFVKMLGNTHAAYLYNFTSDTNSLGDLLLDARKHYAANRYEAVSWAQQYDEMEIVNKYEELYLSVSGQI